MSKIKEAGTSAMWDRHATIVFCDLCLKEVELGNRPTTYFNKEGWQNVTLKFKELTGRDYDRLKLKNKWDQLKKDWKIWKELKRGSTGLGWDANKRTIDAPEKWWVEKLEKVPAAKKFKSCGIDPVLEEKLDGMFTGVVATGPFAFTPNHLEFVGLPEEVDTVPIVQLGDSGGGPSQVHTDMLSTSLPKRPRVEKNKKGVAFIKSSIEKLVESCKARNANSTENSINDCMELLGSYPEIAADASLYAQYMKVLRDPMTQQMFIKMDPKYRLEFLRACLND